MTYSLTIPAGYSVTITASPDGAWNPSIQLSNTCPAGQANTCLAGINDAGDGAPEVLTFANPSTSAFNTFLIIDTSSANAGAYRLDVTFAPILQGDVCSTAFATDAGTVTGTLVGFTNDYSSGAGCAVGGAGPDNVWTMTVPAGNRLTSTLTSPAIGTGYGFSPTVNFVLGTCASALSCVGGASTTASGTVTATWDNVAATAVPVMIVVDTPTLMPAGTYTLTNSVAPATLPTGDVCGNVGATITVDSTFPGETLVGYGNNFTTGTTSQGCKFSDGPDRVYAITVPTGARLTATATNASTANLALSVIDGNAAACLANPVVCSASADVGFSGSETARFDNNSGASKTVYLVVDRAAGTVAVDTFDLQISLAPAPPFLASGESCNAPVVLGPNTRVTSTTTGLTNDYAIATGGLCRQSSLAPDAVFQVTIPANSRFVVTTIASWDMVLNVIGAPAANCGGTMGTGMVCLGGSDGVSGTETVSLLNNAATALTVYVLVDGWQSNELGNFEISTVTTAIPPPPYAKTTIPAACQSMVGSTQLLSGTTTPVIGDDTNSPIVALPFPISFFGTAHTHFLVNNNGLMQVFTSSTGMGGTSFDNVVIPTSAAPNGFIAPFWDDLWANATSGAMIHAVTTGTPPNRKFTVEWNNTQPYTPGGGRPERLTFQAQIYETTNVIEFHYCTLAANSGSATDVTGGSASVGLENATGDVGVQHSYGTASSVNTTDGIRFTP